MWWERVSGLHRVVRVCGCAVERCKSGVVCEGLGGDVGYGIWDMGYQMRLWERSKVEEGRRTLLLRARILMRWVRREGGKCYATRINGRQDRGFGDECGYEGPIGFGWRESEGHWDKFEFCDLYAVLYFYG